ncbi:MAG: acetyl-CoA carboxylase biotin carboxyl carrier protein subunit [Alphaproteobacteria bacterium]
MNVDDVCRLIEIASRSGVAMLEVTVGDARVRIEMPGGAAPTPARPAAPRPVAAPTPPADGNAVRATTDGIVHLQPAPGAPPFVRPGDAVAAGDTLCLIEVMKTFVPVAAPCAGTVRAVRVVPAQAVAFDDVLVELS